jgi:hypothetical protein
MTGTLEPAAQIAQKIDTVPIGQPQVQNDEVGSSGACVGQPLLQRLRLVDHPGLRFECRPDEAADLALVFDQQCHRKRVTHGETIPQ